MGNNITRIGTQRDINKISPYEQASTGALRSLSVVAMVDCTLISTRYECIYFYKSVGL